MWVIHGMYWCKQQKSKHADFHKYSPGSNNNGSGNKNNNNSSNRNNSSSNNINGNDNKNKKKNNNNNESSCNSYNIIKHMMKTKQQHNWHSLQQSRSWRNSLLYSSSKIPQVTGRRLLKVDLGVRGAQSFWQDGWCRWMKPPWKPVRIDTPRRIHLIGMDISMLHDDM